MSLMRGEMKVTVDIVIFTVEDSKLKVLLIKRGKLPFKGSWAIPGGFVEKNEDLVDAAKRELFEETNVKNAFLEQLETFGKPDRDPRGRVVTVAYFALLPNVVDVSADTDAAEARWFDVSLLPKLAFDHKKILNAAIERLRWKAKRTTAAFSLLPELFTLSDVQNIYEIILDCSLDKRNFRKKLHQLNLVIDSGKKNSGAAHRPAKLYYLNKNVGEIIGIL